jgi:hypothetical protein
MVGVPSVTTWIDKVFPSHIGALLNAAKLTLFTTCMYSDTVRLPAHNRGLLTVTIMG